MGLRMPTTLPSPVALRCSRIPLTDAEPVAEFLAERGPEAIKSFVRHVPITNRQEVLQPRHRPDKPNRKAARAPAGSATSMSAAIGAQGSDAGGTPAALESLQYEHPDDTPGPFSRCDHGRGFWRDGVPVARCRRRRTLAPVLTERRSVARTLTCMWRSGHCRARPATAWRSGDVA